MFLLIDQLKIYWRCVYIAKKQKYESQIFVF
jgi:hypothetical protein